MRELKKRLEELNSSIEKLQKRISQAPEGYLVQKNDGHFCWRTKAGKQEYLGKEKNHIIRALLQKKYDKGKLNEALQEEKILQKALKGYENIKPAEFPTEFMKFVKVEDSPDEALIKEWSKPSEAFIPRRIVKTQYYTLRGERVRSKSEIIIADRLFHAGIPYHYEKEIDFVDEYQNWIELLPDFTILSLKNFQTYYWEHFGLLDREDYREDMINKLATYSNNGIFPGKNLIVTFETNDSQLSSKHVLQLIEEYLK